MNISLTSQKRKSDGKFFIFLKDKELAHGNSELEAWQTAESNINCMKKFHENELNKLNIHLKEIYEAKNLCQMDDN